MYTRQSSSVGSNGSCTSASRPQTIATTLDSHSNRRGFLLRFDPNHCLLHSSTLEFVSLHLTIRLKHQNEIGQQGDTDQNDTHNDNDQYREILLGHE